jgi:hypothetical protein
MLVVPHLPEREAVAPEVAPAAVAGVEALRVEAVHALQRGRQRIAKALDDEVVVVRQQAEGLSLEPEALDGAAELAEEAARVVGVEEDAPPADPARRHVPDAVLGERLACEARHPSTVRPHEPESAAVDELEPNRCERHRREGRVRGLSPDTSRVDVGGKGHPRSGCAAPGGG